MAHGNPAKAGSITTDADGSTFRARERVSVVGMLETVPMSCRMIEGQDGAVYEGRPHDLEVTRLQMALDVVEADAEEESRINSQLAQLVCLRLDASRKAVERLLGILQASLATVDPESDRGRAEASFCTREALRAHNDC